MQAAVRERAAKLDWTVDDTADLARVLRLPGTLNHKGGEARKVEVEVFLPERRYDPTDFDDLPAAPAACRAERRPAPPPEPERDEGPPASFRGVYEGWSWLRWCHEESRSVKEPSWLAALSIVGRCADSERGLSGRDLAHLMSRDHAGYSEAKTDVKLARAMRVLGPRGCEDIAENRGGNPDHCEKCPHAGEITSPILLGRPPYTGENPPPFHMGGNPPPLKFSASTAEGWDSRPISKGTAGHRPISKGTAGHPSAGRRKNPPGSGSRRDDDGRVEIRLSHLENEVADEVLAAVVWLGLPDPADTIDGLQSAADVEHLAAETLVRGLEELLATKGGSATAGEILRELEAARQEQRVPVLLSALEELFPRLHPGDLPTTVQLGNKLRSLRARNYGGRFIEGKKSARGVVWTVDKKISDFSDDDSSDEDSSDDED